MNEALVTSIKSRGYWRINFRPLSDTYKLESLPACRDLVQKCNVSLRGWSYPHFPTSNIETLNNGCRGWDDWHAYKEFWMMYQSGQFLHYRALQEDWLQGDPFWGKLQEVPPFSVLEIVRAVYQITEIFEFLARLTRSGLYSDGVGISLSLMNTKDRKLWINDFGRAPLLSEYKTVLENITYEKQFTRDQIDNSKDWALEAILHFFERFGWTPSLEVIKRDQENLLSGKP